MKKIDNIIKKIGKICQEKRYSLVTAESCTGGGLAYFITKNPECSSILERGYVVYSITAKEEALKISSYALQMFGAVSKEVALEMAEKALDRSKAHISIAITGLDEAGATKNASKNSGIVWIACAGINKKTISKKIKIKGNREIFCEVTIFHGLTMLLDYISSD